MNRSGTMLRPRSSVFPAVIFAAAAASAAGCGADGPSETGTVVRDSAGIRIVENGLPAWDETEAWRLEQRMSIGREGDERYVFGQITAAVALPSGRIAVLDRQAFAVRVYDDAGEHDVTIGRRGSGPGEFTFPSRMYALPGDSLMVTELRGGYQVFGPDGTYARGATMNSAAALRGLGERNLGGSVIPLPDGTLLISAGEIIREVPAGTTVRPRRLHMWRADVDAEGDTLAWIGATPRYGSQGGRGVGIPLIHPGAWFAAGGRPVRVAVAESDSLDIRVFEHGRPVLRIREQGPPTPVTPELGDSAVALNLAMTARMSARTGSEVPPTLEAELRARPVPDYWPAHGALHVDPAGRVWAEAYDPRPVLQRVESLRVFDTDGVLLGRVAIPGTAAVLDVMDVGERQVVTVQRDSMEVQHVVVYDIIRP